MFQSADSVLTSQLSAGERLLWSGQPRGGIVLRAQDIFLIPFSLLWGGGVIFWETSAVQSGAPIFMQLWGIPFVLVGLYVIFGRFIADARNRSQTFYGVTDQRIVIISGLYSRQTKSLNLRTLTDVTLTERADGTGTITFGAVHPMNSFFPAGSWPGAGRYAPPCFDLIDRAKDAYEVIRAAQNQG